MVGIILVCRMPQISSKALRPLALLGDHRAPQLPEVPTAREAGGSPAGFSESSWNGLAVPARCRRKDGIARLNRELARILACRTSNSACPEPTLVAQSSTPEQQAELLERDIKRWADVIERAKIPRSSATAR